MSDATPPTENKTEPAAPSSADSKAAAATAAPTEPPAAKPDAKAMAAAKAAAAKEAAKAGLKKVSNLGKGAFSKVKSTLVAFITAPLLIFKGELSTKLIVLGFLASIALLARTGAQLYHRFAEAAKPHKTESGEGFNKFVDEQKKIAIAEANMVFLEGFSGTLDAVGGQSRVFQLELYVECENPETGSLVKARIEPIREIVAASMQHQSYEKLITDQGKDEFRKHIAESINAALKKMGSKGKIRRVYFTNFVLG